MGTMLDEFNATIATDPQHGERVGPYSVFFSGFVGTPNGTSLIGHVMAWPSEKDFSAYGPDGPQYFIGIPRGRAFGRYAPGSWFDIRPWPDTPHFIQEDLQSDARKHIIREEVRLMIEKVKVLVQNYLDGHPTPLLPSFMLIPVDAETGEVLSGDPPQPKRTQEIFRKRDDGTYQYVTQELKWVDVVFRAISLDVRA
jgi:hypothetical protein